MGKHVGEEEEENSADITMEVESPTKIKKEKEDDRPSYEELLNHVSVIAQPMASRKLTKKVYKLLKKASKQKGFVRNGLKDVQRRIRLGENELGHALGLKRTSLMVLVREHADYQSQYDELMEELKGLPTPV